MQAVFRQEKADPKSKTPVLDNFGRDLTKMAEEGQLGSDCRSSKRNRAGFTDSVTTQEKQPHSYWRARRRQECDRGGTRLAHCREESQPGTLCDKRIVTLDVASLVAGTKYRGQFEETHEGRHERAGEITRCHSLH